MIASFLLAPKTTYVFLVALRVCLQMTIFFIFLYVCVYIYIIIIAIIKGIYFRSNRIGAWMFGFFISVLLQSKGKVLQKGHELLLFESAHVT